MRKKDRLVSLFKDEEKLESLLMLQQSLTDKNIPEDEYQSLITRIRYKDPPEWQKRAFESEVSMLKCEISKLKSDNAKARIDLATINREYTEKIQTIPKLKEEYEALENKNKKFRSSIELLIKGNAGSLIEAIRDERFAFNKWSLSAFLEGYSQIVLDTLQYDPYMTWRLSSNNYLPDDPHWFCDRLRQQGQFYIDDWLENPTKWQPVDQDTRPLMV